MTCLPDLDHLPIEIIESTRAVVWNFETRDGQQTKVPYQPHAPEKKASVTDPTTWGPFAEAFAVAESGKADGCGIVIRDGLIGIDLDHCRDPETGEITAAARTIIRDVNSYTEVSVSGTGIHILALGRLPPRGRRSHHGEMYDADRYFILTGRHLDDTPGRIEDRTPQLTALHTEWFGTTPSSSSPSRPLQTTSLDDAELLTLARHAKNGATFTALWAGDTSAYNGDDSAADLAFCNLLAFWTGCDPERMDRLFRQSRLFRDKWDSKRGETTYGWWTIQKAIDGCTETYEAAIEIDIEDGLEPEQESNAPAAAGDWPQLHRDAFVSPIGELAEAMAPHTEADPAALLIHGLVLFGNLVGRNPTFRVGGDVHRVNEDAVCSGDTSIGRKGLAWAEISAVMREVDPIWADTGLQTGLSSGEGLIHVVRDTVEVEELVQVRGGAITGTQRVVKDPGVLDKRVTIIEPEFAKTLRVSRREGNTLSAVIRQAWDDGNLRVLTRQNPIRATGAHLSIIGHITPEELRRELRTTDMASGFINRFLVVLARRSRSLPEGGAMERSVRARLVARLQQAAERARQVHELSRDDESREHWHAVYPQLTRPRVGLVGAICNRAPAHVLRLSCIYALADESALIRLKHQLAALAVWRYAEASAIRIFGLKTGNRLADFFLALLRQHPEGLTRTQLSEALHKHGRADEIHAALQLLSEYGLARCEQQPASKSGGRPVHRWFAVNFDAK